MAKEYIPRKVAPKPPRARRSVSFIAVKPEYHMIKKDFKNMNFVGDTRQ